MATELKEAKKIRRNAKAALTRYEKKLTSLLDFGRPESEVRDALNEVKEAYSNLVTKHEEYAKLIDDDEQFEEAENWMSECQESFLRQEIKANLDILIAPKAKSKEKGEQHEMGISTIQLSEENVPSDGSSIEGGENAIPRFLWLLIPTPMKVLIMTTFKQQFPEVVPAISRLKNRSYQSFPGTLESISFLELILNTLLKIGTQIETQSPFCGHVSKESLLI